ncbi:MAG TPA: hypothetical protein VH560_01985 [Polyangia bacterium]|nr:hypothetical protein [Polyangia bacterium]
MIRRWSRAIVTVLAVCSTVCFVMCFVVCSVAAIAFAKDKPRTSPGKNGPPPGEALNACGCYHDAKGGCVCTDKKAKCECAGDCEPVGCGEKRDKEMEREMAAEIKRAQEDEKRRNDEQAAQENGAATDAGAPPAQPDKSTGNNNKTKGKATRKDTAPKTDKADDK